MNYTITISETQNKALGFVAFSQEQWINNAVISRCDLAVEEIVNITVKRCLDEGVEIPSTKDAIVDLAFDQGWVKSAEQSHSEYTAQLLNLQNQQ